MKPMKVQPYVPLHGSHPCLYSDCVQMVMHTGILGIGATVIRNLEAAVASRADFQQDRLVFLQRKILAHAPVPGDVLPWGQIEVPLVPVISQVNAFWMAIRLSGQG